MRIIFQIIRVLIAILPGIMPIIASYSEFKRGNPYWWIWLVCGLGMATGVALSIKYFGFWGYLKQ